jgi:hypothetical protein
MFTVLGIAVHLSRHTLTGAGSSGDTLAIVLALASLVGLWFLTRYLPRVKPQTEPPAAGAAGSTLPAATRRPVQVASRASRRGTLTPR